MNNRKISDGSYMSVDRTEALKANWDRIQKLTLPNADKNQGEPMKANQMTLMEILDQLTNYCYDATGEKCELTVILPKKVIELFSISAAPKERFGLLNDKGEKVSTATISIIKTVYGKGGTVTLVAAEDNQE